MRIFNKILLVFCMLSIVFVPVASAQTMTLDKTKVLVPQGFSVVMMI